MRSLAVMYHYVMKQEEFKGSVPIDPEEFRNQIKYGKENYIVNVPTQCFKDSNYFLVTFDDATKDQYTNAYQILKEESVKGYFTIMSGPLVDRKIPIFHLVHAILSKVKDKDLWNELNEKFEIPSNIEKISAIYHYEKDIYRRYNKYTLNFLLLEKQCREFLEEKVYQIYGSLDQFIDCFYISPNEIIEMHENGMEIGVHCVHHRPYEGNAQIFYDSEIKPCKEYLTELLGEAPKWYTPSFGGGQNTQQMMKELTPILKENGFIGGFTTIEGFCDMTNDDFWHHRVDCNKLEQFLEKEGMKL
ncbi:polysaccharide deacetylase family protein [Lysinibacillus sp. KU-BSD001]|uniref:polysaccharide deacetylase family protein n=1 Tax=Lysinibacillus sp. KU-BSD001 TaxID=3141328 RepID=UPI0036ED33C4